MANTRKRTKSRGRTGGRGGASGYDFQDIYVALQLTKLLMDDREPILDVLWEKRAIDFGGDQGAEPVHVDDAIIRRLNGRCIYVQVKETAPSGGWSAANFVREGVAIQFWNQWHEKNETDRPKTTLRFASAGDVSALAMVVDDALRSGTPAELLSAEASKETIEDVRTLASGLATHPNDPALLMFLKSLHFERLPSADDLLGQIVNSLTPFGGYAAELATRLVRVVAMSKHVGPSARASHTRASLIEALQREGVPTEAFVAAGLVRRSKVQDAAFWNSYRAGTVSAFRTFRVYGLQVERAVFADLPSLFVPLRLAAISDRKGLAEKASRSDDRRASLEFLLRDPREIDDDRDDAEGGLNIATVLGQHRRFALIGGPGSGKTTLLKWLALVSALSGEEGERLRTRFGLPAEPLIPVFVRFRALAERIRARGLEGLPGRVALVSEFLAADFEAGRAGRAPSRMESLEIAEELLSLPSSIFLFDALDEVADPLMRSKLFEAVADLITRYKEPRVVVSSRPYAFSDGNSPLELALFEPLPLSRTAQRTFARQWYKAVRSHVGDALTERDTDAQATDLAKAAATVPDLAENPLLLSILALVHFNRQGLPVERGVLYDHATLAMLGHWERDAAGRNLGDDAIPSDWAGRLRLQENDIRRVVESLARDVQLQGSASEFDEGFTIDALARGLEVAGRVGSREATEEARLLLKLLVERSGLIQERSPGVFAFVHLSFQDYLTARWYVGAGGKSLRDLAGLGSAERHAEVIRFAVAILRSDHRTEADERAARLIQDIAEANPILAASCFLEAPHLKLAEEAAEDLATRVWDCTQSWRYHLHPRAASRLMWILLVQTSRADELLMKFLALEPGEERRRPREGPEEVVSLLTSRPPSPMSKQLEWVLRRLAHAADKRSWIPFRSIASLVLIESGRVGAQDHLPALVRLLGEEHWARDERGSLGDRAERILRELHAKGDAMQEISRALEAALVARDDDEDYQSDRIACAVAKLLISFRIKTTPDSVSVLVFRGLRRQYRHDEIAEDLGVLLKDEGQRERTIAALVEGLSSDQNDIRRGCARILRQNDMRPPTMALLLDEEASDDRQTSRLRELLSDPTRAQTTMTSLADALWDEEPTVAWRATRILLEQGMREASGLPQTIVRVGLSSDSWRTAACGYLSDLRENPRLAPAVKAALLDALRGENKKAATAAALFLIDAGEAHSDERVARVVKASLRDEGQITEVAARLRLLLSGNTAPLVLRVLGEYFGTKDFDTTVASTCAVLLAEKGYLGTPNLARALVFAGLANKTTHEDAGTYLGRLLEDLTLVTDTRKALSEGLKLKNQSVAWGCAQCLWNSGSRTDPQMAAALTRASLTDSKIRDKALSWLVELLRHPRTATKALAAADEVASESLNRYSGGGVDHNRAWEIGKCLLAAGFLNSDHLVKALVVGGFGELSRHDDVLAVLRPLVTSEAAIAQQIEKQLWSAVGAASARNHTRNEEYIAWGAARTLIKTRSHSVYSVLATDEEDARDAAKAFVETLLRESGSQQLASETLKKLVADGDYGEPIRKRLVELLRDDNGRVARGAARTLLAAEELGSADLPLALIHRGEGWWEERLEMIKMLDDLRRRPLIGVAVTEALQQALWGADSERAWTAAVYLMDSGDRSTPGLARALLFGGLSDHRFDEDVDNRVRALLDHPASRLSSLDALRAALLRGESGRMVNIATLLVLAGEPLHPQILAEFDSEHVTRRWPLTPLTALAISGRVDEAVAAARAGGLKRLLQLLELPSKDQER